MFPCLPAHLLGRLRTQPQHTIQFLIERPSSGPHFWRRQFPQLAPNGAKKALSAAADYKRLAPMERNHFNLCISRVPNNGDLGWN